jgi:transcriptional antiterminator RfaH
MSRDRRWYVVHTHPQAEWRAAEHLRRQGFDVYLPRFQAKRRHARRVETVIRPLFPRYLFVAFDRATERWQAVRSTIGIAGLIGDSQGPTPVAERVLGDLRSREDPAGFFQPVKRFARGEDVKIVGGVFSACIGLFEGMTDKDRITVLLDILGRQVRVVVDGKLVAGA